MILRSLFTYCALLCSTMSKSWRAEPQTAKAISASQPNISLGKEHTHRIQAFDALCSDQGLPIYFNLMPVMRAISAQRGPSSPTSFANSLRDVIRASMPSFAKLARTASDFSVSAMAWLSLSRMLAGVPAGATTPNNVS